jgi:hypothetical protein
MRFIAGHHGARDRIGGLPSHLPPAPSIYPETGKERAFLGQFYCSPGRLEVEGALCIHLYQDPDEDEPCPAVVVVPTNAAENRTALGVANPRIKPFDIEWDYREDPDESDSDAVELTESKAGGTCYFSDTVRKNETLLLQLLQRPGGFNFGGYTAVVVRAEDGTLVVRLG